MISDMFDEPPPRLVKRKDIRLILYQMPKAAALHEWSEKGIIKHFAFLLPEDKRFSERDINVVLQKSNIGIRWVSKTTIDSLVDGGLLAKEFVIKETFWSVLLFGFGGRRLIVRYYMPKSARIAYESQLQQAHKEASRLPGLGITERILSTTADTKAWQSADSQVDWMMGSCNGTSPVQHTDYLEEWSHKLRNLWRRAKRKRWLAAMVAVGFVLVCALGWVKDIIESVSSILNLFSGK